MKKIWSISFFLKKYLFGYVNIFFQILNQKVSVENLRETLYPVLGVTHYK